MATTPEGKVKAAVKKLLKDRGVWFFMPMQNGMGVVGIPDFICCIHGTLVAIETKAPGKEGTVTANQRRQLDGIGLAGGVAIVTSSVEEVSKLLDMVFVREKGREG